MKFNRVFLLSSVALLAFASNAAAGETYYFGTNAARTNISFVGEAELETILGYTNSVSGSIDADGKGELVIAVADLKTGIDMRDEHLRGADWLDASNNPNIVLKLTSLKANGKKYTYKGTLEIKGKSQEISGEAKVKFVDAEKAAKFMIGDGAWVNVKTSFEIKLADYGVNVPDMVASKVSGTWSIDVDLWGTTQAPKS
ncbi:MAG: hypothetical protein AUK47_15350 [Deltaproteobacteria bacterium CG2_30_63_29]|nr:MAG: hypothetical protein AUK47_15350 [Deltaproteobacteria bacterium CG2_30_63_29]PJB40832.1 MAG: hypothetical protein CO108_14245 [Deltaproteobacteria bacterium CG_4_9_14_3_um_filter_63_12]